MSKLALSGVLEGLTALGVSELARYKAAVAAGQQMGWCYYFPYLLSKDKPDRRAVLVAEDEGALCVYQWSVDDVGPRLDVLFPPMPLNLPALERGLERANEFNGDRTARVMRIDEQDAEAVASLPSLRVKRRREQYIYAPEDYESLAGSRYRTLRRQVTQFEALPDTETVQYSPAHKEACQELLRRWREAHRAAHGSAGGASTTARAIELADTLGSTDLRGELVYSKGELVAFAFGGEIRPGVACFFDAKSDPSIPGLSYGHRRSFLLRLREFGRVNDGSDTGRSGLRQLKESFRPVAMHAEYRANQK